MAVDEVLVHGSERCVGGQQVGQGRSGHEEFPGHGVAVLVVVQGQFRQPRQVVGTVPGGGDQCQDGLGDRVGVFGVEGVAHGRLGTRVGEHGRGGGLDGAQAQQERVCGLGVDHTHTERLGVRGPPVPGGHEQGTRPAHEPAVDQRHGQSAQVGGVGGGQGRVQVGPPARGPVGVGEQVGEFGQAQTPYLERGERRVAGVPRTGQDLRDQLDQLLGRPFGSPAGVEEHGIARGDGHARLGDQERGVLQRFGDPGPEHRVDGAPGHLGPGHQVQGGPGVEAAQERAVGMGGLHEQEVGDGTGLDTPAVGAERERADQDRGQVEGGVGGGRGVHDRFDVGGHRRDPALGVDGDRPGEPPRAAFAFLGRTVGEGLRGEPARAGEQAPGGGAFAVRVAVGGRQVGRAALVPGEDVFGTVHTHADLGEAVEREQQRLAGAVEEFAYALGGVLVAQHEGDRGVITLGDARVLGGEGQAQHGYVPGAAFHLQGEFFVGAVGGEQVGHGRARARPGETHRTGGGGHGDVVAQGGHGGEPDPEAAGRSVVVAFGGGPQRRQGLHAVGGDRGTGVRGGETVLAQFQEQVAGPTGAEGGVGGVLCQFHDDTVAVTTEREVLLGVGVLPEPGRGVRPGREHAPTQFGGVEGVGRRSDRGLGHRGLLARWGHRTVRGGAHAVGRA